MVLQSFQIWFAVTLLSLLLLAALIGYQTADHEENKIQSLYRILIDQRGRCSLTHFQVILWTMLILSSLAGIFISRQLAFPPDFKIPDELLQLMGISAFSGVLATGVKGGKDSSPGAGKISRSLFGKGERAKLSQMWLEEEGDMADKTINITKYQNFILTLFAAGFYVRMAWVQCTVPALPESLIWLIGISHAGYVAAKVPNRK